MFILQLGTPPNSVKGFCKDPAWPGWIPLQSLSWGTQRLNYVGTGSSNKTADIHDIYLSAKITDLDAATLKHWALKGESTPAKINDVPDKIGEEGRQYLFTGVLVTTFQLGGELVAFALNFETMEVRFLLRFR